MATKINVACFKNIGVDVVIVPFENSFSRKSRNEKNETIMNLQIDANAVGMNGTIIPFWRDETNSFFIAPNELQPFIRGLSWNDVINNLNQELTIRE
jgi:hypothetical protein